jgi:hypothetical protein
VRQISRANAVVGEVHVDGVTDARAGPPAREVTQDRTAVGPGGGAAGLPDVELDGGGVEMPP